MSETSPSAVSINARDYFGVYPDEERPGFDVSDSLTKAIETCSDLGVELFLPKGTFNTSRPIVVNRKVFMIQGASAGTVIRTVTNDINGIVIGPGVEGNGVNISGYIRDITIQGPENAPNTNSIGFMLDGLRHHEVENIQVRGFTVGFDLVNNCFGSYFKHICASYNYNRVGMILRGQEDNGSWGSGSDIPIINAWLAGVDGGLWVHKNGGGYHFYGGQITGGTGQTSDLDGYGAVTLGKNYYDPTSANGAVGNVSFDGIDFEGANHIWNIRGYGRANISVRGCSFLSTNAAHKTLGVLKVDNAENGTFKFEDCTVDGGFTKADLIQYSGHGSAFTVREEGTLFGYNAKANNVPIPAGTTMLEQSGLDIGVSIGRASGRAFVGIGKGRLRWNNNTKVIEVAKDHGVGQTFQPVTGKVGTTAERPIVSAEMYAGMPYFDKTLNKPLWRNANNDGWVDAMGNAVV
ncbi:hypothetical protein D3C74_51200 [compost metagenome]